MQRYSNGYILYFNTEFLGELGQVLVLKQQYTANFACILFIVSLQEVNERSCDECMDQLVFVQTIQ